MNGSLLRGRLQVRILPGSPIYLNLRFMVRIDLRLLLAAVRLRPRIAIALPRRH